MTKNKNKRYQFNFLLAFLFLLSACGGGGGSGGGSTPASGVTPIVVVAPRSVTAIDGDLVMFDVEASGTAPLRYQWRRNGIDILGASSATFLFPASISDNGVQFSVNVINEIGSVNSLPALLTVNSRPEVPRFSQQPHHVLVLAGDPAEFVVVAVGSEPLQYQWWRNGQKLVGETSSVLRISSTSIADNGATFSAEVSNVAGRITSGVVTLSVSAKPLPPVILNHPADQSVFVNRQAKFTVTANGDQPITYQWQRNNVDIPGENADNYSTPPVTASDDGAGFRVKVSNYLGTVVSSIAFLQLQPGPFPATIEADPVSVVASLGSIANFKVSAGGSSPIQYQWYKGFGSPAVGNESTFTTLPIVSSDHRAQFQVFVGNEASIFSLFGKSARIYIASGQAGNLSRVTGELGGEGDVNGVGLAAHFHGPAGLAIDAANNVYVADYGNATIRKIRPDGTVTLVAGVSKESGSLDGPADIARFYGPSGLTIDTTGNTFVADKNNHTIRQIGSNGIVTTVAGFARTPGKIDGRGSEARFNSPSAVAIDRSGNLIVADTENHCIRRITLAHVVTTIAGFCGLLGNADGLTTAARFNGPTGLAIDSSNNVYVADSRNLAIRRINPAGNTTTVATTAPHGVENLVIDRTGVILATGAGRDVLRVSPGGAVTLLPLADYSYTGQFPDPTYRGGWNGITQDNNGVAYVTDSFASVIFRISQTGNVSLFAGRAMPRRSGTGPGAPFQSMEPVGVVADASGNVYVADVFDSVIRRVSTTGIVSIFAGKAGIAGSMDGSNADARFGAPTAMVFDSSGNLFVVDGITIRKISPSGFVTTVYRGIYQYAGITADPSGNLYFLDADTRGIRKMTPSGIVSTIPGVPVADGVQSISCDASGNLYFATHLISGGAFIYRLALDGTLKILMTETDSGRSLHMGTGLSIALGRTFKLIAGADGAIYVANTHQGTVDRIKPDGSISILAGSPLTQGVVLGALPGSLNYPQTIAMSPDGKTLYVQDEGAILKVALE